MEFLAPLIKTGNIAITVLALMLIIVLRVGWRLYKDNQEVHERRHEDLKECGVELRDLTSTMVGVVKDHTVAVSSLEVLIRDRVGR